MVSLCSGELCVQVLCWLLVVVFACLSLGLKNYFRLPLAGLSSVGHPSTLLMRPLMHKGFLHFDELLSVFLWFLCFCVKAKTPPGPSHKDLGACSGRALVLSSQHRLWEACPFPRVHVCLSSPPRELCAQAPEAKDLVFSLCHAAVFVRDLRLVHNFLFSSEFCHCSSWQFSWPCVSSSLGASLSGRREFSFTVFSFDSVLLRSSVWP